MSSEATRSELVVDVDGSAASFVEERTGEAPPNVTPRSGTQVWLQRLSMRQEVRR